METSPISNLEVENIVLKEKVLLVGAFPPQKSKIYGGVITRCNLLISSNFIKKFQTKTLDSTQKTNPPQKFIFRLIFAIIRLIKFIYIIFSFNPRHVIIFSSSGFSLFEKGLMVHFSKLLSKKVFFQPCGGKILNLAEKSFFFKILAIFSMKKADKIICQGTAWRKFGNKILKKNNFDLPIIYNWSATDTLLDIGENRKIEKNKNKTTFIFLGWIEFNKGIKELLEVFEELKLYKNIELVIAGGGNRENYIKKFILKYDLTNLIKYIGVVDANSKLEFLKNSDVLVLPSWYEGFPNVIIEAMAAKIAVISTNVGNIPDILTNEKNSILIPPKDKNSLKSAIQRISNDSQLLKKISENGFNFAKLNFSTKENIDRLCKLIITN